MHYTILIEVLGLQLPHSTIISKTLSGIVSRLVISCLCMIFDQLMISSSASLSWPSGMLSILLAQRADKMDSYIPNRLSQHKLNLISSIQHNIYMEGLFPGPPDYKSCVLTTCSSCFHNIWWKISGMTKKAFSLLTPPSPKKNSLAVNDFKIVTESQYVTSELVILK